MEARTEPVVPGRRAALREHADMAALLLALAALMGPVVQGGGGRDRHLLLIGLLALVPALVLGRVWSLPRRLLALALGPGLGAVVVCVLAPTGWAGAGDVARFFYAGLLWLTVRRIVDRPERRVLVLVAVSIGGLWQFEQAYLSWWGRGDAAHAMSGTFYAPNVFGAYMAGAGLCAAVLAATGPRPLRLVGFVAAPFCLSAVAFSSSRATIALTVAACALALALLAGRREWRHVGRLAAVLAAGIALASLLGSSLLMSHPGGALAGAASKADSTSQTLSSSGGFRLEWWKAAVKIGQSHPVSGAGFGSFGGAESRFQPADVERSNYAHNVLLQGWADGGAALAVPLGLAIMGLALGLVRRLRATGPAALAAVTGGGIMLAHALLDIDAQYPALLGLAVVIVAVGVGAPTTDVPSRTGRARAIVVLLVIGLAVVTAVRFDAADARYRAGRVSGGAWTGADGPFRDARFDLLRLRHGEHDAALLQRTLRLQADSVRVAWDRAVALDAAGQPAAARALADKTWRERAAAQPGQALSYADVLVALGDRPAAEATLVSAFRSAVTRPGSGEQPVLVLAALAKLGRVDVARCLVPSLPDRLREGISTTVSSACPTVLRPFDHGVGT